MIFRAKNKAEDLSAFGEGYVIDQPEVWRAGVLFASPHSGSIYPAKLFKHSTLSPDQLRRNEDIFIDRLFQSAVDAGVPFLRALFPRAVVDVNRAATELPDHWSHLIKDNNPPSLTPRALAGLGVVPTYLSETIPIYENLPEEADVKQRLTKLYHPYHNALSALIIETKARFGRVLLVDCHSMPGFAPMGSRRPDIILGDRFGTSCHADTLANFKSLFDQAGYSVGINYPYAGGYTTSHYGSPADGVEVIQIEVNRDLYVNPITLSPKAGYERLMDNLRQITREIIDISSPQNLAAQ